MATAQCTGEHRYFLSEVVANQSNGKVYILAICTACGVLQSHEVTVGHSGDSIRLLIEEKQKSKG